MNGSRQLLAIVVTALTSIFGTIFLLWMTIGGKYLNRDEVSRMIEDGSPYARERTSVWNAIEGARKGNEQVVLDLKQIVRDINLIQVEQGRMNVKLDDIRARLK